MSKLDLPDPEWEAFIGSCETSADTAFPELMAIRDEAMRRQAAASWNEPAAGEAQAAYELRIQTQTRRMIEVLSILRRTNTGPAKSKKPSAKGRKKTVDIEALEASLLE